MSISIPEIETTAEPAMAGLPFDRQRTALVDLLKLFEDRRKTEGEILVRLTRRLAGPGRRRGNRRPCLWMTVTGAGRT